LKLIYDEPLSNVDFNSKLRRYSVSAGDWFFAAVFALAGIPLSW